MGVQLPLRHRNTYKMKHFKKLIYTAAILPLIFSFSTAADQVILDDLIVDGSQCVGAGCSNGEEFGFDTLKLKSDTPMIRFEDTSSTSSFPSSDWSAGVEDDVNDVSRFVVKFGNGATVLSLPATESGGIGLGANSAIEPNAVSVGAPGIERKIVHVANGTNATDAVNKSQLDQMQVDFQTKLILIGTRIDNLTTRVDNLIP